MIVEIDIDTGLDAVWRERIDRQISYKFASAGAIVRMLSVRLELDEERGASIYHCRMQARLKNGERRDAETKGAYPNMCVADAAARLARSIRRDRTLASARQATR